MGEALTGLFETGTFTPSVDVPGLRPGIGETLPYTPRIATTCWCCCRLCGVSGGDSNCASKSRRKDECADEDGELFSEDIKC